MSRSYKKTPWAGDTKGKISKRCANSKVRMILKDPNVILKNGDYKKVYESWDICDYGWITTWKEWWQNCLTSYNEHPEYFKKPPNQKEEYRKWYKYHKMK